MSLHGLVSIVTRRRSMAALATALVIAAAVAIALAVVRSTQRPAPKRLDVPTPEAMCSCMPERHVPPVPCLRFVPQALDKGDGLDLHAAKYASRVDLHIDGHGGVRMVGSSVRPISTALSPSERSQLRALADGDCATALASTSEPYAVADTTTGHHVSIPTPARVTRSIDELIKAIETRVSSERLAGPYHDLRVTIEVLGKVGAPPLALPACRIEIDVAGDRFIVDGDEYSLWRGRGLLQLIDWVEGARFLGIGHDDGQRVHTRVTIAHHGRRKVEMTTSQGMPGMFNRLADHCVR